MLNPRDPFSRKKGRMMREVMHFLLHYVIPHFFSTIYNEKVLICNIWLQRVEI